MLTTPQGGLVWVDRLVLDLWKAAQGRTLEEVLQVFRPRHSTESQARAGLACLVQAGLLRRADDPTPGSSTPAPIVSEQVSAILVGFNSRAWLEDCLAALFAQTCPPYETIFVDNGPEDGSAAWLSERCPQVRQIRQTSRGSLARAINTGIGEARGDYLLLLNPDVRLEHDALAQMVAVARQHPRCAAVAPKLHLLFTPSFLNGLGNLVGGFSWGTDLGLGRLDLGQFDRREELPSACFAAALIPRGAIQAVGLLDEGFPLYYEDSEWCYRARLFGFTIQAAPAAKAGHAFGARPGEDAGLKPEKLRQVTYGRLRWITRINRTSRFWSFLLAYLLEDLGRLVIYLLSGKWRLARALASGWADYLRSLRELLPQRRAVQARRQISDRQLFELQRGAPAPAFRSGRPQLTWDRICSDYLPLMAHTRDHTLPEIGPGAKAPPQKALERLIRIVRTEGIAASIYWIGKNLAWRLMQR